MGSPRIKPQGISGTQISNPVDITASAVSSSTAEKTSRVDSTKDPFTPENLQKRSSQGPTRSRSNSQISAQRPLQAASSTLRADAPSFISQFSPPCDSALAQFINQEVAKLPYFDSAEGLSRHVVDQLYAEGPSLPDCMVIAESHGLVESLVLALTCLVVGDAEWNQAPKALMIELNPDALKEHGLNDPKSSLVQTVRANLNAGRDVRTGLTFATTKDFVNLMVMATVAHWLGFEVCAIDPAQQPEQLMESASTQEARERYGVIFSEARELEMSRQLDTARQNRKKTIAITGRAHGLPLCKAADASERRCLISSMPFIDTSSRPFLAERLKSMLTKSSGTALFRTSDSLRASILQGNVFGVLANLASTTAAAQQARARAQNRAAIAGGG